MNKAFEELLWATLITAMLWALLINDAAHLIGMEAADSQGNIWFWQAVEEEEEDPEGYADEYEDENDSERPQQRAGVKKRPGLQGF